MAVKGLTGYVGMLLHNVKTRGVICPIITKRSDCWTCRVGAKRHILSEDVLKLQEFQERKLAVAHKLHGGKGEYFQKLNRKLDKKELILTDELKLLLHLCETPDDVVTARNAIYRYHEDNMNVAFGEFKFGPLFMRLCYELGMEEIAANTIKDKTLRGFFSDSTSFNLAMDMLFMKGYYDSAMEVLMTMRDLGVPFNSETLTVAFAICYKLNTPQSYKICTALLEEAQIKGQGVHRQAYCFVVALALKQKDLTRAESVNMQIMNPDIQICQNLKVLILARCGEMNDVLYILASALKPNCSQFVKKPEFSYEVVDALRLEVTDKAPLRERFEGALAKLQQNGQVTALGLDDMLCHTPTRKRRPAGLQLERRRSSHRTFRPLQSSLHLE